MKNLVGNPDIILVWPKGKTLAEPQPIDGYSVRTLSPELDEWWINIHRKAIPSFARENLIKWLERYRSLTLNDGVLVVTHDATGEPVATAGSIDNDKDGMFPEGGQLAWVATVPDHRQRGLANWLSALATRRLIEDGFKNIFLCTGDDLTAAISVYLKLGYVPCLYASDQPERWSKICEIIDDPFTPDTWFSLEGYVNG